MGRLSNGTRNAMAVALVKHRFAARAAELVAESVELFRLVYDGHYDADTRRHMAAILKKHRDAIASDDDITVNVAGRKIEVGSTRIGQFEIAWLPKVAKRPMLADQLGYNNWVPMDSDHPLAARLLAFSDARESLRKEIEPAKAEALGALQQFTTGKKLSEEWPEAMPVIGSLIPENDRTLPVVQVAHLNSKFDLPPSERLAA